jgi:hypothetical protein
MEAYITSYNQRDLPFEYKGFLISRTHEYQLWHMTKDGQRISRLNGLYTAPHLAQSAIDEFLITEKEKRINENKSTNRTKNSKTSI